MAMIRSSNDLQNKYNEISEFCHQYQKPVFITKNGTDDLVVMSNSQYELLCGKFDLHHALDAGLTAIDKNSGKPAATVFSELKERFGLIDV